MPAFRVATWIDSWKTDLAFAIRSLARTPWFVALVVLTLALGLGTNAAVFSVIDQIFLRPPAGVNAPAQLRRVWLRFPVPSRKELYVTRDVAYHYYTVVASAVKNGATLAAYRIEREARVGRGESTTPTTIAYATANYFGVAGTRMAIGRAFTNAEADIHGAHAVVVISDGLWHRALGGDSAAIGHTIAINEREYTIIGITAPDFTGVDLQQVNAWLPLGALPTHDVGPRASFWDSSVNMISVIGRMNVGASVPVLQAKAAAAYHNAPVTDFPPDKTEEVFFALITDQHGPGAMSREAAITLRLGLVALLVLLVATANVANLLLARTIGRRREIAVRLALGITRQRLLRILILDGVLLALLAATGAIVAADMTSNLLRAMLLPDAEFAQGAMRWTTIALTAGLALLTGLAIGIVAAMSGSKTDVSRGLKASAAGNMAPGRISLAQLLLGAQAALSVVLLVGAVLLVRSRSGIEHRHIGFDISRVAFASVTLPQGQGADTLAFASDMRRAADRLRASPQVSAVAFAREEPMTWFLSTRFYTATDSSDATGRASTTSSYVSANFFDAAGLSFVRGRSFADAAPGSDNSVIINAALAKLYWPGRNPIGECIYVQVRTSPCLAVIGVVNDAIRERLLEDPAPQLYFPIFTSIRGQHPPTVMIVRATDGMLRPAMDQATRILHETFPRGEARAVPMAERLASQYRPWRLAAALFTMFGALALVIAVLGIYSNVSYHVAQHTRELGIRIALGAGAGQVVAHVVRQGARPVTIGAIAGAAMAAVSGRAIASLLYGVEARNVVVIGGVVITLVIVGVGAALIPGWRATRIDPLRVVASE